MKKLYFFIVSAFIIGIHSNNLNAQGLQFNDLIKAYSLDSISLKEFCTTLSYGITKIKVDNWNYTYMFQSNTDKKLQLVRTFPKDKSISVILYYYFNKFKEYKSIKSDLMSNGYTSLKVMNVNSIQATAESYMKDQIQIEIITSSTGPSRYTLLIHRKLEK